MENTSQQFEQLFHTLATGSTGEIKDAKKKIEKQWHNNHELFKKADNYILKIIQDIDSVKDGEHKAAVISGLNLFILALEDRYFDELSAFVLKCITDQDGRVREAVRHIASWLRIKNSISANRETYTVFLDKIEGLMKRHAPLEKPSHIGDYPSSIYKSLILLWHDISLGTSNDYEHREYLMDPTNEEYIPFLGNSVDEEEVDPQEVEMNIWADKADGDPVEGVKWLNKLEEIAARRFEDQLIRMKFNREEVGIIMSALRVYGHRSEPRILDDMLNKITERSGIIRWADANNFTREMEAYVNHVVGENLNGQISHLLVEAIVERECSCSGKPDDLAVFLKLIYQSHEAIVKDGGRFGPVAH